MKEGDVALPGAVLVEAKGSIEGHGTRHVDDVGVEDDAGERAGGDASKCFGDEGAGEALVAEGGGDEEALDLGGAGVVGGGPVDDAGGGLSVDEGEEDFAVARSVRGGEGAGFFVVGEEVEGSAGLGLAEEVAVLAEEGAGVVRKRRVGLNGLDDRGVHA